MKLYRTSDSVFVEHNGSFFGLAGETWDNLIREPGLHDKAQKACAGNPVPFDPARALAPVISQEVWAAGVTYYRSRSARIEESKDSGGGTFYDRVYSAERPELFFKAAGKRVIGPGGTVRIRSDAHWSVPEPEWALVINPRGEIVGYTIGNDMSSRDIEGENPLYLPQAKVYDGSCAMGPCILLADSPMPKTTRISIDIERVREVVFTGSTTLEDLKRSPEELVEYLFRELTFPDGALLMTGTGVVPKDEFTLQHGDAIRITIDGIGTLENVVG